MKRWINEEINLLKLHYPVKGPGFCSKLLERSNRAIINKASKLGITTTYSSKSNTSALSYSKYLETSDYELLDKYILNNVKVLHRHKTCGYEWLVSPNNLRKLMGCPKCSRKPYSKIGIEWLKTFNNPNIQHAENGGEVLLMGYKLDGYDPISKIVYEFHGDAFHGNLNVFEPNAVCHPFNKELAAEELWKATYERMQNLAQKYKVIYIWESEYRNGKRYSEIACKMDKR